MENIRFHFLNQDGPMDVDEVSDQMRNLAARKAAFATRAVPKVEAEMARNMKEVAAVAEGTDKEWLDLPYAQLGIESFAKLMIFKEFLQEAAALAFKEGDMPRALHMAEMVNSIRLAQKLIEDAVTMTR